MNLYDIQLAYPLYSYLLWFTPLILFFYALLFKWRQERALNFYGSDHRARGLISKVPLKRAWLRAIFLSLSWLMAVFALMGPRGNAHYPEAISDSAKQMQTTRFPRQQILFFIDASASMSTHDTRTKVSRLQLAKNIAEEIISLLPGGLTLSLEAFTSQVFIVSPPTQDYFFVRMMLGEIAINEGETSGTSFDPVIVFMKNQLEKLKEASTIIFLSDGGDNNWEKAPKNSLESFVDGLISPLKNISTPYQFFSVGIGTAQGATIPTILFNGKPVKSVMEKTLLESLASKLYGKFWAAETSSDKTIAEQIVAEIKKQTSVAMQEQKNVHRAASAAEPIYDNYFQYPLLMAMLFLSMAFILPLKKRAIANHLMPMILGTLFFSACQQEKKIDPLQISGEHIAHELRFAAAEASLGLFSQALSRYSFLLNQKGNPQLLEAILFYNKALIEIKSEALESARTTLLQAFALQIKSDDLSNDLLTERLYECFAFLEYKQILKLLEKKDKEQMDWAQIALINRNFSEAFKKFNQLTCNLEEEVGVKDCKASELANFWQQESLKFEKLWQKFYKENGKKEIAQKKEENLVSFTKLLLDKQAYATAQHTFQYALLSNSLEKELIQEQKEATELALQFIPKAVAWQKQFFAAALKQKKKFCFDKPWQQIFPLADKGVQAAISAQQLAINDPKKMLWRQYEAWEVWKQVYELIKENQGAADSSEKEEDDSFKKNLQNLEQMMQEEGKGHPKEQIDANSGW